MSIRQRIEMMKRAAFVLFALSFAGAAIAQESEPPASPDYSREKLIQIFANNPERERAEPRVQYGIGYINFKALGMRWRINYLPIMMPLPGSIPWASNGAFGALPDPFLLTGTEFASPPRTWRQSRDMNAELRRIEKSERARAKVTVKPE